MIHIDNLEVVPAVHDNTLVESSITVLRRVQQIMRTEGRWLIRYVPREDSRGEGQRVWEEDTVVETLNIALEIIVLTK
ncbi:hypothetical protein Godav_013028, partial [Gossypium davidsonii]|nr:hypothetical protein [Gossypium davidsonii]